MQSLRNAAFLARLVLAWFALSIGVAIASPVIKPQAIELICSGAGVVKIVNPDDGTSTSGTHTLDCPMCLATPAPAPARNSATLLTAAPAVLQPHAAVRIAALTAAPFPARGPPAAPFL